MKKGYNRIFWGFIIVFFSINLGSIPILPPFIGYLIVISGIIELERGFPCSDFTKAFRAAVVDGLLSFITFCINIGFFGSITFLPWHFVLYQASSGIVDLLLFYYIFKGTSWLFRSIEMESKALSYERKAASYIVASSMIRMLSIILVTMNSGHIIVLGIAAVIITIWLVIQFLYLKNIAAAHENRLLSEQGELPNDDEKADHESPV